MPRKIRVLVVDDSASVRSAIVAGLSDDPQIEVVGTAINGVEAVQQVQALKPDVVTLDVEMPRLDGLGALEQIMTNHPTPVVMVSSLTREGAAVTIQALELGAVDFALKTAARGTSAVRGLITELAEKIRQAATAKMTALTRPASGQEQGFSTPAIAQDEDTCVVYGMPRSVAEAGYVDRVVPLSRVASAIIEMCRVSPGRAEGVKV